MTYNFTTITWLLLGFLGLSAHTLTITLRAWRATKRSPYFFLRRQAELKMHQYGTATCVLGLIAVAILVYARTPVVDSYQRMALIESSKPATLLFEENIAEASQINDSEISQLENLDEEVSSEAELIIGSVSDRQPVGNIFEDLAQQVAIVTELPARYSQQFTPDVALKNGTTLGEISFSRTIDDGYQAINPRRIFDDGQFTLYATFDYVKMADGMEWAWVWRFNGDVVDGGTQLWNYGDEGPGYVYYSPEKGFSSGEYTLQIWVNEKVLTQSNFIVTSAASR